MIFAGRFSLADLCVFSVS